MKKVKIRGNQVLLKGTVETKTSSGIIIAGNKNENVDRKRYTKSIHVLDVGSEVKDLKKGDEVITLGDTIMKLSYNVAPYILTEKEKKELEDKKDAFYILVPEEEIKGKICKE